MSAIISVYLRELNQTLMSGSSAFAAQDEAALSLPEGAWAAGVVAIIVLLLLVLSLISKGKKVYGRVVRSVCTE